MIHKRQWIVEPVASVDGPLRRRRRALVDSVMLVPEEAPRPSWLRFERSLSQQERIDHRLARGKCISEWFPGVAAGTELIAPWKRNSEGKVTNQRELRMRCSESLKKGTTVALMEAVDSSNEALVEQMACAGRLSPDSFKACSTLKLIILKPRCGYVGELINTRDSRRERIWCSFPSKVRPSTHSDGGGLYTIPVRLTKDTGSRFFNCEQGQPLTVAYSKSYKPVQLNERMAWLDSKEPCPGCDYFKRRKQARNAHCMTSSKGTLKSCQYWVGR